MFLLTDNRESRWLPSVAGAALKKIVICVALGYDSYLVMRHGLPSSDPSLTQLGCYFCNDIQAPTNTTSNLALDEQCTVARPGLAPIASALAVEVLVSLLHHPLQAFAPHILPDDDLSSRKSPLGGVPHMMKGSVFHFSNTCVHGPAFCQCTACSETVTSAYLEDRWKLVLSTLKVTKTREIEKRRLVQDSKYLQNLTGLNELLEKVDVLLENEETDSDFEIV